MVIEMEKGLSWPFFLSFKPFLYMYFSTGKFVKLSKLARWFLDSHDCPLNPDIVVICLQFCSIRGCAKCYSWELQPTDVINVFGLKFLRLDPLGWKNARVSFFSRVWTVWLFLLLFCQEFLCHLVGSTLNFVCKWFFRMIKWLKKTTHLWNNFLRNLDTPGIFKYKKCPKSVVGMNWQNPSCTKHKVDHMLNR